MSRGKRIVLHDQRVPAAKASGKGAWLCGKWFGGNIVWALLSPVVASVVSLVESEYETILLLFGHGLMVISSYCEKHAALTRLFRFMNSRDCAAALGAESVQ